MVANIETLDELKDPILTQPTFTEELQGAYEACPVGMRWFEAIVSRVGAGALMLSAVGFETGKPSSAIQMAICGIATCVSARVMRQARESANLAAVQVQTILLM